jgi:hypothetical protein
VSYEAAWTLVSLSTAPTAVRSCAQTYAQILNSSTDNNVKLIVLDRLSELKKHHAKVVQEVMMDILRALASPNIHICKKTLALAIDLVGPRNIEEVMALLKREVIRSQETEMEHGEEYKSLLIQAIHKCATRYAEVADSVVLVLLDFLGGDSGYNVIVCVKVRTYLPYTLTHLPTFLHTYFNRFMRFQVLCHTPYVPMSLCPYVPMSYALVLPISVSLSLFPIPLFPYSHIPMFPYSHIPLFPYSHSPSWSSTLTSEAPSYARSSTT